MKTVAKIGAGLIALAALLLAGREVPGQLPRFTAWVASLGYNVTGSGPRATYLRECAVCHRDDMKGAPPQIPSLVGVGERRTAAELSAIQKRPS